MDYLIDMSDIKEIARKKALEKYPSPEKTPSFSKRSSKNILSPKDQTSYRSSPMYAIHSKRLRDRRFTFVNREVKKQYIEKLENNFKIHQRLIQSLRYQIIQNDFNQMQDIFKKVPILKTLFTELELQSYDIPSNLKNTINPSSAQASRITRALAENIDTSYSIGLSNGGDTNQSINSLYTEDHTFTNNSVNVSKKSTSKYHPGDVTPSWDSIM